MINVRIANMDYGIHEIVFSNHDGSYTIFLNARDCHERRIKSYEHALEHLKRGDFEKLNVQEIETDAHDDV